jgi:hypothetical protein
MLDVVRNRRAARAVEVGRPGSARPATPLRGHLASVVCSVVSVVLVATLWVLSATSTPLARGTATSLRLPDLTFAVPGPTVQGLAERIVSGSYDRRRSGRPIQPGVHEPGADPNPPSTLVSFHDERPGSPACDSVASRIGFPWLCAAPANGPPFSA